MLHCLAVPSRDVFLARWPCMIRATPHIHWLVAASRMLHPGCMGGQAERITTEW